MERSRREMEKKEPMTRVLIASALIGLCFHVPTGLALSWTDNLLSNPGAEAGTLASWVTDDPQIVVASQSQSESSGVVYPNSGDWFFNMAPAAAAPSGVVTSRVLYQDIDVTGYVSDIDGSRMQVLAGAFVQTEDVARFSGADYAELSLYFLNDHGEEIDRLSTGLLQSPNLVWIQTMLEGPVPAGTRAIRFELLGEKHERSFINAFFDDANLQVAVAAEPMTVAVDIKPRSCPNPLNPGSHGILPVVVLGSEDFDVDAIDVATVCLAGVGPVRSSFEDVAAPVTDGNECECTEEGPDGYMDLTVKFGTTQIAEALINTLDELSQGELLVLALTCALYDGTAVEGRDCVKMVGKVPRSLAAKKADVNQDGIVDLFDFAKITLHWLEPTF